MNTKDKIKEKCRLLEDLLVRKNDAYGDSALEPLGVFSSANASTGIKIRLDDKLKRIANAGLVEDTEDTLTDIAGYIILLMIAKDNEGNDIQKRIRERGTASHTDRDSIDEDTVGEVWFSDQSST
tara:strand:+ start:1281 stop:1655 length:375 start_codon:yes stop_codon:yes gene_type:complete